MLCFSVYFFFFFNDTATTEIYTLSLHDALPIWRELLRRNDRAREHITIAAIFGRDARRDIVQDRKSTRLNSSHLVISYAVFCLKKKKDNPYTSACLLCPHHYSPPPRPLCLRRYS